MVWVLESNTMMYRSTVRYLKRVFVFCWYSKQKCSLGFCLGSCRGIKLNFQKKEELQGWMKAEMTLILRVDTSLFVLILCRTPDRDRKTRYLQRVTTESPETLCRSLGLSLGLAEKNCELSQVDSSMSTQEQGRARLQQHLQWPRPTDLHSFSRSHGSPFNSYITLVERKTPKNITEIKLLNILASGNINI